MVAKALAAEVGLGQAVALDERPRGAVEHENPFLEQRAEQEQALIARLWRTRSFSGAGRRGYWGDLCGRCRWHVSVGGPASFCAQCTGETECRPSAVPERPLVRPG
jgi:hypothetical protein